MIVLSVETLDAGRLLSGTDASTLQKGRTYYYHGRARVEETTRTTARLAVRGSRLSPYQVLFRLEDGRPIAECDCPLANGHPEIACKHKVAATLALQDYLRFHPVVTWETTLAKAMNEAPKKGSASRSVLVFSLQQRTSAWGLYPYSLPASAFPEIAFEHLDLLHETVKRDGLSKQAKSIRSKIDPARFVNASDENRVAAHFTLLSQSFYLYYYDRSSSCGTLFPLLANTPLYLGSEDNPLKQPLRVSLEKARAELEMEATEDDTLLSTVLALGDQVIRIDSKETQVVSEEPLWLMADWTLFQIEDASGPLRYFLENPSLEIPAEEADLFLERYLPMLAERIPIRGGGLRWEELEEDPVPRVYLSEAAGEMRAHLRFGYGAYEVPYDRRAPEVSIQRQPGSTTLVRIRRRPDLEEDRWKALSGFGLKRGGEPSEFLLRARTEPVDFLLHQVPRLADAGYEVYGEEALTSARVNRNRPRISFNVTSGIDWFDVQAVVNYGDLEVSLKDIRRALKKRERYIKLADGSIGEIPKEWLERYRHLFALGEETDEGVRLSQHHLTLLDQVLADADRARTDEEFQRRRSRLRDFSQIAPKPLPSGFVGELRPYQKAGYDWLHFLHEYEFGGCLADDMGIGKTIQALAFLQSLRESGHAKAADLIVLPRSLIFNWEREAARFTPDLSVHVHAEGNRATDTEGFDQYDVILTTYGVMLRDIEMLRQHRFHYVILDESQAIKNPLALTSRAARLLQADHQLVLTGTPVENSTMELWSQFAFLNPGLLGNLDYFREEFGTAIEKKGDENTAQFLRKMVYPFILRRTKDQVAPELPPREERLMFCEMEAAQRRLYEKTRDYYRAMLLGVIEQEGMNQARMKVLEGLLRLRQICNHPLLVDGKFKGESSKFELLMETLETLQAEGHKALVFSQFVQMLKIVRNALDARKIPYTYLDGATKDRQERVDTFQNDASIPFFLISLKAGGVGLNLTAADYVIHIDPWWNPAVEMQATDRTHRIGQDRPVFVYKLIAKNSVEEKILQLQDKKRALVDQLISTESSFFKSLTPDDIKVLFD